MEERLRLNRGRNDKISASNFETYLGKEMARKMTLNDPSPQVQSNGFTPNKSIE
jgi:hypothetical protein